MDRRSPRQRRVALDGLPFACPLGPAVRLKTIIARAIRGDGEDRLRPVVRSLGAVLSDGHVMVPAPEAKGK